MGLEERRKLKELQEGALMETLGKIKTFLGVEIPIEVDVASFADVSSLQSLQYSGLTSLVAAIEEVGKDDLGKDALKESLKKIVFKNLPNDAECAAVFDGGVLTNSSTWGGGSYAGQGAMTAALLAKL
jgi:hypothetical protein